MEAIKSKYIQSEYNHGDPNLRESAYRFLKLEPT